MPQLVKGGKHAFAWSVVNKEGRILIPLDAFKEYQFTDGDKAIVMSGSKTSGGFGLTTAQLLMGSPISGVLDNCPALAQYRISEGEAVTFNTRVYTWVTVSSQSIKLPFNTLQKYSIRIGDRLLSVRGSNLALGFIVRGPIVKEARKHPELKIFK